MTIWAPRNDGIREGVQGGGISIQAIFDDGSVGLEFMTDDPARKGGTAGAITRV
jgi:hypothetical protein